jgi:hypothetical protein
VWPLLALVQVDYQQSGFQKRCIIKYIGINFFRHALLYGIEPVAFEASDGIGGLWRYKPYETPGSIVN